jgi:chondroitin AC lyase
LGLVPASLALLALVAPLNEAAWADLQATFPPSSPLPAPAGPLPTPATASDPALAADIATIKSRLLAYFLEPEYPDAEKTMKTQKPDGSWPDINYADTQVAAWDPAKHMDRVKQMAAVYAQKKSPFYHSPKMLAGVVKGLQFWYARKPKSDNWWHNTIGQQLQFERIFLLLDGQLPLDVVQTGLPYFMDLSPGAPGNKATGQNLIWFDEEYMEHGLLTANVTEIQRAVNIIQDTIVITDKEGIQVDYSFHQHGSQLYNGGYGQGFLEDTSRWASYLAGTRFAIAPEKIDIISHYLLDGSRWMMRGPLMDYGTNGRGLVRKPGKPNNIPGGAYCDQLAALDPPHAEEYHALRATIRGEGPPWTVLGNKQFWRSDFMVDQTKDVYFSVKMNSSRTVGIETINGENLKGYWLPFGLTYIAPTGKEYDSIFPVWDWAHLPGITCPEAVYKLVNNFKQPNTFVGGVSDGTHGACAMKLDIESSGESLHAHKAWFFFGDEIVALGAGISSTLGDPVDTTLNQTLLKGPVVVDGKTLESGEHNLKSVSWVLHNGIGYLFPDKSDVVVNNHTQTGSWQSISSSEGPEAVSEKVFSLWVNHGVKPTDGKYAYVVVPGMDKAKLAKYAAKLPVHVIANTTDLQAVRNDELFITQAIFYTAGSVEVEKGTTLQVDQPCMVQVTETKDGAKVVLSSPMSGVTVHVTLGSQKVDFDLPADQMEGSSQSKDVTLP